MKLYLEEITKEKFHELSLKKETYENNGTVYNEVTGEVIACYFYGEGEDFDAINLKDVIVTAVHVEPRRVVFNFEDILFRHDIDEECSGKAFEETPLGVYLATHFSEALEKYIGKVKVSLLSKENVIDESNENFMPYFKPVKNRIKVPADENDTWYWWLKTPSAPNSASFWYVYHDGRSGNVIASHSNCGVAPAFEIKDGV